jgi:site-specific DNA-cytosine methylase
MITLSLFDGMSATQQALKELGVPVSLYYASEVDSYAIKITQKNFPNTIQLGDVCNVSIKL